jgi:hypothetical protein
MLQRINLVPFILTIIAAVIFQIGFICWDSKDTPARAVKEFAQAYFRVDASMSERLCEYRKYVNGADTVDQYIYEKTKDAADRGFGLSYVAEKLYDPRTTTVRKDEGSVQVRLTARVRPPLKSFFSGEGYREIDETLTVINEEGKWKVCGKIFSLPGNE